MYKTLHNLVLGFHGCSRETYENVLYHHEELSKSTNDYDWLGNGIYFWENSYERALEWAQRFKKGRDPSVIGAVIDLGLCLNLSDYGCTRALINSYHLLCNECNLTNTPYPQNSGKNEDKPFRCLDCAVIERLHRFNEEIGFPPYDSVRGVFFEGKPIYPSAGFRDKTHIQLCVRNPNCIKGYFSPKEPDMSFVRI